MFVRKKNSLDNSGQSLVEVLVAITVGVFVVVALINAAVAAMRNAQYAKNQNIATKLAQEGMEQVRAVRDRMDWNAFATYGDPGKPCYTIDTTAWQLTGSDAGCLGVGVSGFDGFTQNIKIDSVHKDENNVTDQQKVTIKVSWIDSAGTHNSELVSFLTKWVSQ